MNKKLQEDETLVANWLTEAFESIISEIKNAHKHNEELET